MRVELDEVERNRFYSKLRITSMPNDPAEPVQTETIELITGEQRTAYVTKHLSLLEDKDARIVVVPMDSVVYIYDHMPTQLSHQQTWWKYTDLAFKTGKMLSCQEVNGKPGEEIVIEFDVSMNKEMGGISRLRFKLDAAQARPISYRSLFSPNATFRERTFDFLSYQPGKEDPRVARGVLAQILPNGKLAHAFRGFELKDMRSVRPALTVPEQKP
jgi:hypothetical protein